MSESMDERYGQLWATHRGGPFAQLDESLQPRPHAILYDVVSGSGGTPSATILDAGCGRGNHTCTLARQFGCRMVGLDPTATHVAQARADQEGVDDRVTVLRGTLEALPFEGGRFDIV